jgi:magnesium transporter
VLARVLEDAKIVSTTDPAVIRAALEAKKRIWIELERQSPEADAVLQQLEVHPLTIEDIYSSGSQPKIDDFPNYLYVVVHGIGSAKKKKLDLVEVDVLVGENWVLTYDRSGLVADDIGTDLDHSPRMLAKGAAWLAHGILDRVVDRYLPVIDELDVEIERLENDVIEKAGTPRGKGVLSRILTFKRTLQTLRRMSVHQREILLKLSRGEYEEIPTEALPFFRDVYDHFLRIQDITEGYRDLVTSALDAYLSVQSNRMNEIVKTLTLMSTVMLPLSFIAGLYGMNFKTEVSPYNMPELGWYHGYPFAIGLMLAVAIAIVIFFWKKGYIGSSDKVVPDDDKRSKRRTAPPKKRTP